MKDTVSFGNNTRRSYDDFQKQVPPQVRPLLDLLRNFCFSLGENVAEDVRMHRVVFCKSITFRWFADLEPQNDCILLKIQKERRKPHKTMRVIPGQNLDKLKEILQEAFSTIH